MSTYALYLIILQNSDSNLNNNRNSAKYIIIKDLNMAVCNNNDNILSLFYCSFYINKNRTLQNTDNVLSRKSLFTTIFFYLLRFQNSSNQVVYRNLLLTFEDGSNIILQLCLHISNSPKKHAEAKISTPNYMVARETVSLCSA